MIKHCLIPGGQANDISIAHTKKGDQRTPYLHGVLLDFQKENTSVRADRHMEGWNFQPHRDGARARRGGTVSWSYFDALRVKPCLGRILPGRRSAGSGARAILGQALAEPFRRTQIIGRNITIEGDPTRGRRDARNVSISADGLANLWTPLALTDKERADRDSSS